MIDFNKEIENNAYKFPVFYRYILKNEGTYKKGYTEIRKKNFLILSQTPFYKLITSVK